MQLHRSVLAAVEHVAAPVLAVASLGTFRAARFFLAQAHRFDLAFLRAHQQQHFLFAVGALLPQGDVVLTAAALVAVALDQHLRIAVLREITGVRLQQRLVLVLDVVLVVIVVKAALGQDVVRILERIGQLIRFGRNRRDRGYARLGRHGRQRAVLDRGLGLVLGRAGAARQQGHHRGNSKQLLHSPLLLLFIQLLKNGPQAGSRTSAACTDKRCFTLPSLETAASEPRLPIWVAYRIILPLGAKVGDSSCCPSVSTCPCLLARSNDFSSKRPPSRAI